MVGTVMLRVTLLPDTQVSKTLGGRETSGLTIIRSLINMLDWSLAVVARVVLC